MLVGWALGVAVGVEGPVEHQVGEDLGQVASVGIRVQRVDV